MTAVALSLSPQACASPRNCSTGMSRPMPRNNHVCLCWLVRPDHVPRLPHLSHLVACSCKLYVDPCVLKHSGLMMRVLIYKDRYGKRFYGSSSYIQDVYIIFVSSSFEVLRQF